MDASRSRLPLREGPFLVVGLARSGRAVATLLAERGETVLGVDSGSPPDLAGLGDAGVEISLDADGSELLQQVNVVVKSPGVPNEAPVIAAAREQDIPVLGELEIAWRLLPNRFVAVTGTNGKTTVVEWLGHVWREADRAVEVAGNVGTPLSSLVGAVDPEATIVCECSSFQLEDTEAFAPHIAVLLNLTPDHLDRHGSVDAYRDAKLRIFAGQRDNDFSVFDADEAPFAASGRPGRGATVAYGSSACSDGGCLVRLRGETIEADGRSLCEVGDLALPGAHNVRNAMAVAAAALSAGLPAEAIARGLRTFTGVAHRLERVAEIDRVHYVNDSKATNVAAAAAAVGSFEGGVHLIAGGSLKGGGFEDLATIVGERCRAVYLIGEAAAALRADLEPAGVELTESGTLESAVAGAAQAAVPGETVLLAPACASFDAFADYIERGERFRELVEGLR